MDVLQLLLERKLNEVGKLIKETEEKITDLAENISQAKVNSSQSSLVVWQLSHKTSGTKSLSAYTHSAESIFGGVLWAALQWL